MPPVSCIENRLERQKETGSLETSLSHWIKTHLKWLTFSIIWANKVPLMFKPNNSSTSTPYNRKHHNWFSYVKFFLAHNKFSKCELLWFFSKLFIGYSPRPMFPQMSRDEHYWCITLKSNSISLQWQATDNFIKDPIISAHNKHSWSDLLCAQARLSRAGQRV